MRKLTALLLTLALVIGLVPAAFAKTYTLDIYWIANVNSDKPYNDIAAEVNDYLADKKADPTHVGKIVEAAIGKYLTDTELKASELFGVSADGATTADYRNAVNDRYASSGKAMVNAGIVPSASQLEAMGWTPEQYWIYKMSNGM